MPCPLVVLQIYTGHPSRLWEHRRPCREGAGLQYAVACSSSWASRVEHARAHCESSEGARQGPPGAGCCRGQTTSASQRPAAAQPLGPALHSAAAAAAGPPLGSQHSESRQTAAGAAQPAPPPAWTPRPPSRLPARLPSRHASASTSLNISKASHTAGSCLPPSSTSSPRQTVHRMQH